MEKLLTKWEQRKFEKRFVPKKHPMETTDWDTIVSDAATKGSTIFLSDAYKRLPKRYRSEFSLRRRELTETESSNNEEYRFAIQVKYDR